MTIEYDGKFEEKLTFGLENDLRNSANFHKSTEILKIVTFIGSFSAK